jgi:hypothetical protein
MDIRLNTNINGVSKSIEINALEDEEIMIDLNQSIVYKSCICRFATYNNLLKVYFDNNV